MITWKISKRTDNQQKNVHYLPIFIFVNKINYSHSLTFISQVAIWLECIFLYIEKISYVIFCSVCNKLHIYLHSKHFNIWSHNNFELISCVCNTGKLNIVGIAKFQDSYKIQKVH